MKKYYENKLISMEKFENLLNTIKAQFSDLLYWDTCGNQKTKYYSLDNYYRLYCAYLTDDKDETDYFLINLEYLGPDYVGIIGIYESEQATLSQLENCISEALITYYNILEQKYITKSKENKQEINIINKSISNSWQKEYWENDECFYRDIDFDFEDCAFNGDFDGNLNYTCDVSLLGRYQIVFEYDNQRYYCFIDAPNLHTALGIFFKNHSNLSYDNIIEHLEI